MPDDYYEILGLARGAEPAAIQKAYRSLAKKYHPDLHPDDASAKEKFKKIQQAYDVLNDAEKRQKYDQFGPAFEHMGAGPGPGGGGGNWSGELPPEFSGFDFSQMFGGGGGGGASMEDIFRQFGGGGRAAGGGARRQRAQRRGNDLEHELEIPFKTAVLGGETHLRLRRPKGPIETLTVKIPAGIDDGQSIRLRGQGEPGPGDGPNGDLLIRVKVQPHAHFTRRGADLEVRLPITIAEAVFGAKLDVPTPHGEVTVAIPAGTSSGKKIRLRGQGVKGKSGTGDLYVEIQIVVPKDLDAEATDLLKKLDARLQQTPRTDLRW